jgi:hypothetical protein
MGAPSTWSSKIPYRNLLDFIFFLIFACVLEIIMVCFEIIRRAGGFVHIELRVFIVKLS